MEHTTPNINIKPKYKLDKHIMGIDLLMVGKPRLKKTHVINEVSII